VTCDIAVRSEVVSLRALAYDRLGSVDAMFANAGVGLSGPILDADPQAFDWIFGVNVKGTWNTLSVFGNAMLHAGRGGRLCITASEHALGMQHNGMGLYTATKHAILGMADVLRSELSGRLGVSVVCPGLVATDLHLSKRNGPLAPDPQPMLDFSGEVMSRGMHPGEIARAAIDGVERGDFFIVTHPAAIGAATRRYDEIADAFAAQAAWYPDAAQYEVDRVVAAVRAKRASGGLR
jgi:NAD(P)-dependent dehydrogenase (short-subunit alcohol dehydrogenase family)